MYKKSQQGTFVLSYSSQEVGHPARSKVEFGSTENKNILHHSSGFARSAIDRLSKRQSSTQFKITHPPSIHYTKINSIRYACPSMVIGIVILSSRKIMILVDGISCFSSLANRRNRQCSHVCPCPSGGSAANESCN
jgi:hypothetical protein